MADQSKIRVRLAPSPTGPLHVGTARTALFNYLFAKKRGGTFIIRIEDTDPERSKQKWERDILKNLDWLNLKWDEGPTLNSESRGDHGPYRQSERSELYNKYLNKLLEEDKAYRCFCTEEELEAQREQQIKQGEPPRYTGKCRSLSEEEVEQNLEQGKSFVIRLKNVNHNRTIKFEDMIRGKVEFDSNLLGDFSLSKKFEQPLYNFAVVVDDHHMEISHVIRGEDHIPNTPKQILVYKALNFDPPEFAHLPLILGEDESKLSKRHGAVAISEYRKQGYLPEALVNFMAFLGWNPGTKREIFSLDALVDNFELDQVQKSGSQFDLEKLEWFNGNYIREKPLDKLTKACLPYLLRADLIEKTEKAADSSGSTGPAEQQLFDKLHKFKIKETEEVVELGYLKNVIALYQERLKRLSEAPQLVDFFFKEELNYDKELLRWKDMNDSALRKIFDKLENLLSDIKDWNRDRIEDVLMPAAEEVGDRGKMLWPLRAALTGKEESAGPFEIAGVLGKGKTLQRIKRAKQKIK